MLIVSVLPNACLGRALPMCFSSLRKYCLTIRSIGSSMLLRFTDFGHLDYAGVARLLKLDPNLSEAVVAVKLQEVRDRKNKFRVFLSVIFVF